MDNGLIITKLAGILSDGKTKMITHISADRLLRRQALISLYILKFTVTLISIKDSTGGFSDSKGMERSLKRIDGKLPSFRSAFENRHIIQRLADLFNANIIMSGPFWVYHKLWAS